MNGLPPSESSPRPSAIPGTFQNSDPIHKTRKKKPFEEPMTPEFRKKYLENIIKFVADRINEAQHNLSESERYLKEAQEASDSLVQKTTMINNLRRKPSESSLKQIEFLKDFIPKLLDKKKKYYEHRKLELTIALDFNKDEIREFQEELNDFNNKPNKI